jgi:glycosyltransferase involved in cell wall biosynthesis
MDALPSSTRAMDRPRSFPQRPPVVLHVVDTLAIGGAQTILRDYFESRPEDAGMFLYVLRASGEQTRIAHPGVRVNPSSRRFSMAPLNELRRFVVEHGIEVVHCHLFRAQVFGYLLRALYFPKLALIFHEHGRAVGREGESALEASMFKWFLRLAWRRVDWFICISEHTRASLIGLVPGASGRSSVVSNPIPVYPRDGRDLPREAARVELGIPDEAFVVGFASRLVERKGWRDLLEAMKLLQDLPVLCFIAGDGEDRRNAEAAIRDMALESRVRILGHIHWMPRFYRSLDCFVMPSRWEPHGLAHLEAQSFGIPVIVSDVPGLSATVHASLDALLFPQQDTQRLAAHIRTLATDPALRAKLAAAGRANAASYTMASFSERLANIHAAVAAHYSSGQGMER